MSTEHKNGKKSILIAEPDNSKSNTLKVTFLLTDDEGKNPAPGQEQDELAELLKIKILSEPFHRAGWSKVIS